MDERPAWLTRAVGLGSAEGRGLGGPAARLICMLVRAVWAAVGAVRGGRGRGAAAAIGGAAAVLIAGCKRGYGLDARFGHIDLLRVYRVSLGCS